MNNREIALAADMAESEGGGGGGGTSDYEQLTNKPSINGNQLIGNKSSAALGLQSTIDSAHKLDADLTDDSNSSRRRVWKGTAAEWEQQKSSVPAGTPYIITDNDVAPCYFDSTTGEFYVDGVKVLAVMTEAAYEALVTKSSIWYATYATPSNSRTVETTPLTKNEEPETKKSVEMEVSDEQLEKLPPFGFGGYDE